ncbi:uncharacterized protein N7515_009169 [Penicillium bovifimosum]|uniref:Uncharacterized protein n=1 Tax=Penicillium bovifimosum TaxID=126998 RepID=A0A9W9KVK5_9EURO|nr:uncharacterized protein N7515_009169 [Penicillium bovifimosum]KAJ5121208.1 hypothetical protein N7515_009169 [Penicillium bovifimosum]
MGVQEVPMKSEIRNPDSEDLELRVKEKGSARIFPHSPDYSRTKTGETGETGETGDWTEGSSSLRQAEPSGVNTELTLFGTCLDR